MQDLQNTADAGVGAGAGPESPAETSKAGLRRMRRLHARPPVMKSTPTAAIHPTTSDLIYPAPPTGQFSGYLTSSLFSATHPAPLPTSSVLTPGNQLSISPEGDWTIMFHPNPSDEGGTLAIYPISILSPVTTAANIAPLATFPLASEPLAITHLYPPRTHLSHSRSPPLGPRPPTDHDPSHGPDFLVLLSSGLLLFHPQAVPPSLQLSGQMPMAMPVLGPPSWTMNVLRCPLNTRWHATAAGKIPPDDNWRVTRGWMGLVPGNRGVWIGWERGDQIGVTRAAVGLDRQGKYYMQTTPMPSLPRVDRLPFGESFTAIRSHLQSIVFVAIDKERAKSTSTEEHHGMQVDGVSQPKTIQASEVDKVQAVLVYHDSSVSEAQSRTQTRTRLEVHSFERIEVELAQGFSEIGSGSGDQTPSWDWSTLPAPAMQITSPISTAIIALYPLPAVPPYSLALAVVSSPDGFFLSHIDLAAGKWTVIGEPVDLGDLKGEIDLEISVSQGVARGQLGLVALVGRESGPKLVIVPRLEGQSSLSDGEGANPITSISQDAATCIILAERQGVDWSDAIRAVVGSTGAGKHRDLISSLAKRVYDLALDESKVDELNLLLRVQIAMFALDLASDILRLKEASNLVDGCAIFAKDGKISFDLDSIWPLIDVMEWAMDVVARAMKETILFGARVEWGDDVDTDIEQPSHIILIAHPIFRSLTLRLLSQLSQLTSFLHSLELPILQPETRSLPAPIKRDPMATIVARDRIKDVAYSQGFDVIDSGKELEAVSSKDDSVSEDHQRDSLLGLSLLPLRSHLSTITSGLSAPSTLFLSSHSVQSGVSPEALYDGITFQPLASSSTTATLSSSLSSGVSRGGGQGARMIKCGRCDWATEQLGVVPAGVGQGQGQGQGQGGRGGTENDSSWNAWKKQWATGCMCGGTWRRT